MPFLLLMPSYNQVHYIAEAVESCLAQDDGDWELWILDNSSDATPEVMKRYTDPRVHFIHEPRRMDPGSCLNQLLTMAKGDHFSYIHTDNRLSPGYVRKHRAALSAHPLALVYCDYWEIDAGGRRPRLRKRPREFPLPRLFSSDSLGVPFSATTALATAIGGFTSEDLADDVYFVIRADGVGPRIHLPEPLVEYRVHGDSRTEIWGEAKVRQAIYRSAMEAYRARDARLPDPFAGMGPRIAAHVAKASAIARPLAASLLKRVPSGTEFWIDGVEPPAFWLAWACAEAGRQPAGFIGKGAGRLLGLPVRAPSEGPGEGALCLRPRRRGAYHRALGPGWTLPISRVLRGLPLLDHVLKPYPADVMASLLIPQHAASKGAPIWVGGDGAMAAYLAFGIESLAGLEVSGWMGGQDRLGPLPTVVEVPEGAEPWVPRL